LEIGAFAVNVYLVSAADLPFPTDIGGTNEWKTEIYVREDAPRDVAEAILLHEITHCALFHGGCTKWDVESIVNAFAGALHQALAKNGLLSWPQRP
jgi:hypothetical protein